jgi:transposase
MIVIGADAHKSTHTLVALDGVTGRERGKLTVSSRSQGVLEALMWAADLEPGRECVCVIEDVRHVSGRLERELVRHGQAVVRLPPRLMAGARPAGGLRGTSDQIDAAAVALAAIRAGIDTLPIARLEGVDLDLQGLAGVLGVGQRPAVARRATSSGRPRSFTPTRSRATAESLRSARRRRASTERWRTRR